MNPEQMTNYGIAQELRRVKSLVPEIMAEAIKRLESDPYAAAPQEQAPVDKAVIEGTVYFLRSKRDAEGETKCACCPDGHHIFGRAVKWDVWATNRPEHFGNGPDVLVGSAVTDKNKNEGKRVRVTVEVLQSQPQQVTK